MNPWSLFCKTHVLHSSEIPWGSRLAEVSSLSLSLWDVLTTIGAAQHHLSLATSTSLRWPPFSGQAEVAGEQLPPPSGFSRLLFVPVLSSQTMVGAAGVLPICSRPFLGFPARVQALAGGRLHGQGFRAQPSWQEWRGFAFMQISHVLLTSRRSTGKDVSCVWFWVGGSGSGLSWAWERDYGVRPPRPLPPPALRHHNTTTRAHTVGVIHSVPRLL